MVKSHKYLQVWQLSVKFEKTVYELTAYFRRAAVSVPSKIAEGAGRSGKREWTVFIYFFRFAIKFVTQLEIAKFLLYTTDISEKIPKLIHIR